MSVSFVEGSDKYAGLSREVIKLVKQIESREGETRVESFVREVLEIGEASGAGVEILGTGTAVGAAYSNRGEVAGAAFATAEKVIKVLSARLYVLIRRRSAAVSRHYWWGDFLKAEVSEARRSSSGSRAEEVHCLFKVEDNEKALEEVLSFYRPKITRLNADLKNAIADKCEAEVEIRNCQRLGIL